MATDWQPISTAPKDGRQILVAIYDTAGEKGVMAARWIHNRWRVCVLMEGGTVVLRGLQLPYMWMDAPTPPDRT